MRKLSLCLFYGLCVFTLVFSLFWMALPRVEPPSSTEIYTLSLHDALPISAQALPELDAQPYYLCDVGGHLAVYTCKPDGTPDALQEVTDIYVNLLPENDALRIKRGFTVTGDRALDHLLEDLGG